MKSCCIFNELGFKKERNMTECEVCPLRQKCPEDKLNDLQKRMMKNISRAIKEVISDMRRFIIEDSKSKLVG